MKNIIKVFKTIGFEIGIETNLHEVNFLDITFDLTSRTYCPLQEVKLKNIARAYFIKPTLSKRQAAPIFHQRKIMQKLFQLNCT